MVTRALAIIALCLAPLFGGQSLRLTTGDTMSFTPPETATWQALGAVRVEISATITTCSSTTNLFKFGNFRAFCTSATSLTFGTNTDAGNLDITGKTNIVLRMQRDPSQTLDSSNGTIKAHMEVWDADGTGRVAKSPGDNATPIDASTTQSFSVGTSDVEFHWIKVYSTLTEVGVNSPLPDPHGTGDLANWDFEGVLTDSGPDGMTFATSGTAFGTTPAYNPVADPTVDSDPFWMQAPSVRAGAEVALSAARSISHDDVDGLTCVWSDQSGGSGPTAILFTGSTTACETTAVFPTFGDYDLRLVVTDDGALTDTADITVGAVATDANRIVVMDDADFAFALGEQIQWGKSAWPYLSNRAYKMAEYFLANRAVAGWQVFETGTVTVSNGSATVQGAGGTDFANLICSGGSTPEANSKFVIRDDNGIYWANNISSCTDADTIVLSNNWNKASDSGLSYAFWVNANSSLWINGSDNENYYDVVWAYYTLCKTSGLQWACTAARELAELWWTMPYIAEGAAGSGPLGGAGASNPRIQALIGIMLWAKDQGTEATVFPGIEDAIEYFDNLWITHPTNYCPVDPRESWYVGMWLSLARELDTDPTRIANYESILTAAMDASTGVAGGALDPDLCRYPNGGWITSGLNSMPSAGTSTVSVTNGSPTFTCATPSACSWTAGDVGKYVQVGILFNNDRWSDMGQYLITAQDSSTLTVSPSFAGTTGSGRFYFIRSVNTWAHQGLGNAMPNLALDWQYQGGFSDHRQAMVDTFDYIEDKLYWSAKKGLYNLTDDGGCAVSIAANTSNSSGDCQFDTAALTSGRRFLSVELTHALTNGVKYGREIDDANTAARVTFMDTLMGAALGGLKGPSTDTSWADEYDDTGCTFVNSGCGDGKPKNFGFMLGVGGAGTWDAERLGGLAAEDLVSYSVPLDIAGVSGATKASVTLYEPRGFSRVVNDQTGSSCTVTGDERQGDHLAVITYRDAMNNVVGVDSLMVAAGALNEPAVQVTGTLGGSFTIQ